MVDRNNIGKIHLFFLADLSGEPSFFLGEPIQLFAIIVVDSFALSYVGEYELQRSLPVNEKFRAEVKARYSDSDSDSDSDSEVAPVRLT